MQDKHTESLGRREFLKASTKLGVAIRVTGFSTFALSVCSKDSQSSIKFRFYKYYTESTEYKNVESQTQISQDKGVIMEFIILDNDAKYQFYTMTCIK